MSRYLKKLLLILALGLMFLPQQPMAEQNSSPFKKVKLQLVDYPYVISINNTSRQLTKKSLGKIDFLKNYFLYELPVQVDGKREIYLRIGFFSSRVLASQALEKLNATNDRGFEAEILPVQKREFRYLSSWVKSRKVKEFQANGTPNNTRLLAMMEEARQAMVKNDYHIAITRYSEVVSYETTDFFQAALEYLGLARERNKQFAQAREEYERYLRLYPEGDGSERVRQRLIGLVSATMTPRKKLRKARRNAQITGWQSFGSFSQYYRRDTLFDESLNDDALISGAYSSFFYSTKLRTRSYDLKNRISVSHNYDFESDEDNALLKVSTLYSEANFRRLKMSSRIGRQTQNTSGAFGRFDGAVLSYHYKPNISVRAISGYPVEFGSYDQIQTEKRFYSFNLEIESLWKKFDFNSYFITQFAGQLLDRRALGFELRHFSKNKTMFSSIDYDVHYQVMNNFVLNASYKIVKNNSLGIYLIHRKSPLLTTSSALQGQSVDSLKALSEQYTDDEISDLAEDRTAEYNSITFTWSQKLRKNLQWNHDYTLSDLSSTSASGDVLSVEGTGLEHFISTQLMVNGWLKKNDVTIVGLRYASLSTSDRITMNFLRRDIFTPKTRLSSKLRLDYQSRTDDSVIYTIKPSVSGNYRMSKRYKFEAEFGIEQKIRKQSLDPGSETNLFFLLGYLAQF